MKPNILRDQFRKYLELYQITIEDNPLLKELKKDTTEEVDVTILSQDFFDFLLFESDLSVDEKTKFTLMHQNLIINKPQPKQITDEHTINGIDRVYTYYSQNLQNESYNFQINFYGKTIPVHCKFEMKSATRGAPRHILLTYEISIVGEKHKQEFSVYHKEIINAKKRIKKFTFYDLMANYGLFKLELDLKAYDELLIKKIK